jgi:putative membrane protein
MRLQVFCVSNAVRILWAGTLIAFSTASAGPLTDSQILGIYIQVNGFDIETALLGRAHGQSGMIRKAADRVAADHIAVRQTAYQLAEQCGIVIELPTDRDRAAVDHAKAMVKLVALNGTAFDRAYAEHEVAFHRAAIAAVRTALAPQSSCPVLKRHLNDVVPAFEHHLSMAETTARQLAGER